MCAADVFATCSRDKTVRVWREAIGGVGFACSTVCVGHESFVTALAFAPNDASSVVSGGRDRTLVAWDPASGDARGRMRGHALDVTAVCILSDGRVVSGSMDKSIKIFDPSKAFECVETFDDAHDSSVLALVALPDAFGGGFLSGSADATIRAWKNASADDGAVFGRHADPVRGLALNATANLVLSASHDTTARAWTPAGDVVATYRGHSALVYAVASSACGTRVVTGSEDDTARLWLASSGECAQVVPHPGCVWSVAYLPPPPGGGGGGGGKGDGKDVGDFVTCCADGSVRVWTASPDRVDAAAAKALEDFLVARAAERAARQLADAQSKLKLEPPSVLAAPGDRDGATKVIKEEGGSIAAYSWSAAGSTWERLGEVTGVGDGAGKKTYAGQEYDYVFDVDFKDGAPPLKLPFNDGDNPYAAAEQFLETSGLPMEYREQVVNFIVQNVGSANVAQGANVDPFTGAGAYVPGGVPTGGGAFGAGGGGYGGSHDPFTGGGAYVPSAPSATTAAPVNGSTFKYLPMRTPVAFETAKYDGILRKLSEFGAEEGAAGDVAAACNGGDPPGASSIAALAAYLESWPVDKLFPLLDLCRMAALRGDAAGVSREVASAMAAACARSVAEAPRLPANLLTAGRLFCNAFRHEVARDAFVLRASEILVRPRPKEPNSDPDIVPLSSSLSTGDVFLPRIVPWPASTKSRGEILRAATSNDSRARSHRRPPREPSVAGATRDRAHTHDDPGVPIPPTLPSRSLPRTRSRRPRQTRRLNSNARLFLVSALAGWIGRRRVARRQDPREARARHRRPQRLHARPRLRRQPRGVRPSGRLRGSRAAPVVPGGGGRRSISDARGARPDRRGRRRGVQVSGERSGPRGRRGGAAGVGRVGARQGRGGRPQAGDVEVRSRRRKISEGGERFGGLERGGEVWSFRVTRRRARAL